MRNKSLLRLVHLSPNSPKVNLVVKNTGSKLFQGVSYKEVTDYVPLNPSTYNFEVTSTSTNEAVLYVPNMRLLGDRFYSFYVIGLLGGEPPIMALLPLDGNSYIKF